MIKLSFKWCQNSLTVALDFFDAFLKKFYKSPKKVFANNLEPLSGPF